jgi:hypothetical protein
MKYKDKNRYAMGWSDVMGTFSSRFADRVEYKVKMSKWIPPRYAVVKYVNGGEAETIVDGVSQDTAKGYVKLLQE